MSFNALLDSSKWTHSKASRLVYEIDCLFEMILEYVGSPETFDGLQTLANCMLLEKRSEWRAAAVLYREMSFEEIWADSDQGRFYVSRNKYCRLVRSVRLRHVSCCGGLGIEHACSRTKRICPNLRTLTVTPGHLLGERQKWPLTDNPGFYSIVFTRMGIKKYKYPGFPLYPLGGLFEMEQTASTDRANLFIDRFGWRTPSKESPLPPISAFPSNAAWHLQGIVYFVGDDLGLPISDLDQVFSHCTNLRGFSGSIHCGHGSSIIFEQEYNMPRRKVLPLGKAKVEDIVALKSVFAKAKNLQEAYIIIQADIVPILDVLANIGRVKVKCNIGSPVLSSSGAPTSRIMELFVDFWEIKGADVRTVVGTLHHAVGMSCVIRSSSKPDVLDRNVEGHRVRRWALFRHTLKRLAEIAYDTGPRFIPIPQEGQDELPSLDEGSVDRTAAVLLH